MYWAWFLLFLLYGVLLTPYSPPSELLWRGIQTTRLKRLWAVSMLLAIISIVWIAADNKVEDWVWFGFIFASLLWIPSLYMHKNASIGALFLVVLTIIPMLFSVEAWVLVPVLWLLFHATFFDLILWNWYTPPPVPQDALP